MNFLQQVASSPDSTSPAEPKSDSFWVSTGVAILMMLVAEAGDKTFIASAIFGAVKDRFAVVMAVLSAMTLMTAVSIISGDVVTGIAEEGWVNIAAIICYCLFAFLFIRDAWHNQPAVSQSGSQPLVEHSVTSDTSHTTIETEQGSEQKCSKLRKWLDVYWKMSVLTFFSEWADRTQISTYRLSQEYEDYGVGVGCLIGQLICTLFAIMIGRYLKSLTTERKALVIGGFLFLSLAAFIYFFSPGRRERIITG